MLLSTLRLILRSSFRHLTYSIVTLAGLIAGLSAAILLFFWVTYEVTYDRYHSDNARVFAVMTNETIDGEIETYEETPASLTEFLSTGIADVEAMTRFDNTRAMLSAATKSIQMHGAYADSGYFKVFRPSIVAGDASDPISDVNSISISTELAKALYPNGDALGNTVTLDLKTEFKITSIFELFPVNSSLRNYHFILPFHATKRTDEDWQNLYVKLRPDISVENVEARINQKLQDEFKEGNFSSLLFPLTDWRLRWNFENGKVSGGRIVYVVIFSVTGIFILLMACVNYVNIATARAAQRAREVGVRKMSGASQWILIRQFMSESFLLVIVAAAGALGLSWIILPLFNELTGVELQINIFDPMLLAGLGVIVITTTIIAGSYPAFLLASLRPALVLKGSVQHALRGTGLRRTLTIFQVSLSVILIFGAVVLRQQTNFLLKKDIGYDKQNVINVWCDASRLPLDQIRAELMTHSAIIAAGFGGASPMEINGSAEVSWTGKPANTHVVMNGVSAHYDMLTTLDMRFVAGRNFSRDHNDSSSFIITEEAARRLGFDNPIGQTIRYSMFGEQEGQIIGVVKDFQNDDIHVAMNPVIFTFGPPQYIFNLFVRYEEGRADEAIAHITSVFKKFQHGVTPEYTFLDADFENQFYQEKLLNNLSAWFTTVAIIIASLGLFGLTLFNTERRTKEIGVRKMLGASVPHVLQLLLRDILKTMFISFLIAFPIAWYLMEKFLEGYAFRISIPALSFVLVILAMLMLVILTTGYQSMKAALKNPVDVLKTD